MGSTPLLLLALLGCRTVMTSDAEISGNPIRQWERVLAQSVTDEGLVDYDHLEANREALDKYVAWVHSSKPWEGKKTRERHALYLNAYNALVLFQVLERDRPPSVLEPRGWIPKGGSAFFVETAFVMGPDTLSLSEIEHERIRMKELDYRDHAAMNCASMSCPPMRPEVYLPVNLDAQLTDQMNRWMQDERTGVRIEGDVAVFNPIFDWFERDFWFTTAGMDRCEIAAQHTTGAKQKKLLELHEQGCPHRTFDYDWALNDASNR